MRGISWPGPELYWYYILFEDFIIHDYRRHHHHHPYSIISRVVSFYSFPFLPFFSWMQIKLLRRCASRRRPHSRTCDTAMAVLFGILLLSKCCQCVESTLTNFSSCKYLCSDMLLTTKSATTKFGWKSKHKNLFCHKYLDKLAKHRRHISRVHFASNGFGPIHFVLEHFRLYTLGFEHVDRHVVPQNGNPNVLHTDYASL